MLWNLSCRISGEPEEEKTSMLQEVRDKHGIIEEATSGVDAAMKAFKKAHDSDLKNMGK